LWLVVGKISESVNTRPFAHQTVWSYEKPG